MKNKLAIHNDDFFVIGHRGAAGLEPENTLPSFQRALTQGCRGIELDVHRVFDAQGVEHLCVIHDERVDRTTNQSGLVSSYTKERITALDAGQGASVPLLNEVVDLFSANASANNFINIELKGANTAKPLAAFLSKHPQLPVLVSSFDHGQLHDFRALTEHTPIAPLFARKNTNMIAIAQGLNASCINVSQRMVTQSLVSDCLAAGYRVFVYTVNRYEEAMTIKSFGVAGVFTDRPDLLMDLQHTSNQRN